MFLFKFLPSHAKEILMTDRSFLLASMLCTKLCHDITGPVGAINNGVEFMAEETGAIPDEIMDLVASSALEAVARLQFYRRAYGRIIRDNAASITEQYELTKQFFAASKVNVDWPDSHTDMSGIDINQQMAQLLLNMVIVVQGTIMREGVLKVRIEKDATTGISFMLESSGGKIKENIEISEILKGDESAEIDPKTAQAYLTVELAKQSDMRLLCVSSEDSYRLMAQKISV